MMGPLSRRGGGKLRGGEEGDPTTRHIVVLQIYLEVIAGDLGKFVIPPPPHYYQLGNTRTRTKLWVDCGWRRRRRCIIEAPR